MEEYMRKSSFVGLSFEHLECRVVPATFLWNPTADDPTKGFHWDNPANCEIGSNGKWVPQNTVFPGAGDEVQLLGSFNAVGRPVNVNNDCIVNVDVDVKSLVMAPDYAKSLVLVESLTVTQGFLSIANPSAQIRAASLGDDPGLLTLVASNLSWSAGEFVSTTVHIDYGSTLQVRASVSDGPRKMVDTAIYVTNQSQIDWSRGTVSVVQPRYSSLVHIDPTSEFLIQSTDGRWGTPTVANGAASSYFEVYNAGMVRVNADGVPLIRGDYTTAGDTRLEVGIFKIEGKAEQVHQRAKFDVRTATTVEVTHNTGNVLGIRKGLITGTGTVDANLVLSSPTGGEATIQPVLDGGLGTLTVVHAFQMLSSAAIAKFIVTDNGDHIVLSVRGAYAALDGLLLVDKSEYFRPMSGTLPIITAAAISGNFDNVYIIYDVWDSFDEYKLRKMVGDKQPNSYNLKIIIPTVLYPDP